MLSDESYEELSYQLDKIDDSLYQLCNDIEESHLSQESEDKLVKDLDTIISKFIRLREQINYS